LFAGPLATNFIQKCTKVDEIERKHLLEYAGYTAPEGRWLTPQTKEKVEKHRSDCRFCRANLESINIFTVGLPYFVLAAMESAVSCGDVKWFGFLLTLDKNIDVNTFYGMGGNKFLKIGSKFNPKMFEFLLNSGADFDMEARSGKKTIHFACCSDNVQVVEMLLDRGASLDARDSEGQRPLHLAAKEGKLKTLKLLLKRKDVVVDCRTNSGQTPLHVACIASQVDAAKMLIAKGADVNAFDSNRKTPLHYAVLKNCPDVARSLMAKGASTGKHDFFLVTPMELMEQSKHPEIKKLRPNVGVKTLKLRK